MNILLRGAGLLNKGVHRGLGSWVETNLSLGLELSEMRSAKH